MFKRGDFILVKPNTKLESGEIINGWGGEIHGIYDDEKCCLIGFDTQTIQSLSDEFLKDGIEMGAEPFEYVFKFDDIELSKRRDTDQQLEKALDGLVSRVIDLEKSLEEEIFEQNKKWIEEFQKSDFFKIQNKSHQENSNFVLSTFMEYMHSYQGVLPKGWTPSDVEEVCLSIVPRKIVADEETFRVYGEVLIQFFKFLREQNYIDNAKSLINKVQKIKEKILVNSKNPRFHGMTKSLMNGMDQSAFTDEDGELDMKALIAQLESMSQNEENERPKIVPLRANPFKGIGRNQKITVKYNDGRVVENIKFKKAEMDLKNGNCELM